MAKYVVRPKVDKSGKDEKTRYYASAVSSDTVDLAYIAKEVSVSHSLTEEDVISAFAAVARFARHHLAKGDAVNLKGFGLFTVSASSEGCETPQACTPAKVKAQRVCFRADNQMRGVLEEIKYEPREGKQTLQNTYK